MYESNAPLTSKRKRKPQYGEINDHLYDWYLLALRKNIIPDGPTLIEQAKTIAQQLQIEGFKASNGWLQKWKSTHSLKSMTISGESAAVPVDTVQSWKERLPEILEGYCERDVLNMDETGCWWKSLPQRGFSQKGNA